MNKTELKRQLNAMGITVKNNLISKKDIINILAVMDDEDTETEHEENLPSVNSIPKKKLADAAQKIYDAWDVGEDECGDWQVGFGGICHLIADAMCDVLDDKNIQCSTVSSTSEVHVYVVGKFKEGVYTIDIDPYTYETGGGYNWKKIPDIELTEQDILVSRIDGDPSAFETYIDE